LSDDQVVTVSTKRVFDAYALWTFSPSAALRLLASNLGPDDYVTGNSITAGGLVNQAITTSPTYTNWQLRLELKL
jgi:iron complex outermembrane receptor protein